MYIKGYDAIQEHPTVYDVIMRPLTALAKDRMRELLQQGMSTRQIATMTHQSHMTVSRVRKTSLPQTPKPTAGRPSKLTDSDKRRLARMVVTGRDYRMTVSCIESAFISLRGTQLNNPYKL